jgi:hypothetical protein
VYIGATSKLPRVRWNYGYGYRNSNFYSAIKEHGWNNILHEVVATSLTEEQAYELEEKLIAEHDATNPEKGYNLATGRGTTGVAISEETRQRLVTSHLGKKNPHTPEWNKKISDGNRGKSKPHKGVPRSEYSKQRTRETHSISVLQYSKDFILLSEYPSMRHAESATGVKNQYISKCCLGKQKTAGGYIWKYKNQGGQQNELGLRSVAVQREEL